MAITKCRIGFTTGEPVHSSGESIAPVWPHQRRKMVSRCSHEEKIMTDTIRNTELTESELDNVIGGEITVHSTDYSLVQTLCVWSNCLGLMGVTFQAGAHGGTHPV
jgi:bacteriocin-like protein